MVKCDSEQHRLTQSERYRNLRRTSPKANRKLREVERNPSRET
ncbi:hypothetical protein Hanom_Chr03g00221261 [Helianthus anomalus]